MSCHPDRTVVAPAETSTDSTLPEQRLVENRDHVTFAVNTAPDGPDEINHSSNPVTGLPECDGPRSCSVKHGQHLSSSR